MHGRLAVRHVNGRLPKLTTRSVIFEITHRVVFLCSHTVNVEYTFGISQGIHQRAKLFAP